MIDQANVGIAPGKRMLIKMEELRDLALMKKEVIITARITHEIKETIQSLADRDERTLAWMIRRLILEALEARSLLETGEQHSCSKTVRKDVIKEETAAYRRDVEGAWKEIPREALMFLTIPGLRSNPAKFCFSGTQMNAGGRWCLDLPGNNGPQVARDQQRLGAGRKAADAIHSYLTGRPSPR